MHPLSPPTQPMEVTDRGPQRGKCPLQNPVWQPTGSWTQAGPKPGFAGPDSTPRQGALPWPSLSPPTAFPGLPACPLPSSATLTRLSPYRFRGHCKRPPHPHRAPVCSSTLQIRIPSQFRCRVGRGVEDVGEEKALHDQRQNEKASLNPRIRKRGSPLLFFQGSGLCLGWGVPEASFA